METSYEFVNLTDFAKEKIKDKKHELYDGGEICLEEIFENDLLIFYKENEWQGNWGAIAAHNDKYVLISGYFGSCSGCDILMADGPIVWIDEYFKSVRQFDSLEEVKEYLKQTDDYSFRDIKHNLMFKLSEIM